MAGKTRSDRRWLGVVLLLGLVVRLGWVARQPVDPAAIDALPDQREYLELGRNLLAGRGLALFDPRFGQTVYAYRTPGYPIFVAACGGSIRGVRVAQAVVDVTTALAVYVLARRWLGRGGAVCAAAGLVTFNPYLVYFTGLVLSETLFIAMLTWGLALVVRSRFQPVTWWAGTIVLALSVLVRPSAMGLPVLLGTAAAWVNRPPGRAYRWGSLHRRAGGAALLTVLILLPWALRNKSRLGAWVWTSTNEGITKYDGFNPSATGASDQTFVARMPELRAMGEAERSRYLSAKADEWIRAHPLAVAKLTVVKAVRTWSPLPLSEQYGRARYAAVGLLYSLAFDLLVLAGVAAGRLPRPAKCVLLLPAAYFTVVHAASIGSLRYRLPAEPPMAVVAASVFGGFSGGRQVER